MDTDGDCYCGWCGRKMWTWEECDCEQAIRNSRNCGRSCNESWDVRCCCEPGCPQKNTMKQFNNCIRKIPTLYFHIGNNYEAYNCLIKRDELLKKQNEEKIKNELSKTTLHELTNNIFDFARKDNYLRIKDIRKAIKIINKNIRVSQNECQHLLGLMIRSGEFD